MESLAKDFIPWGPSRIS